MASLEEVRKLILSEISPIKSSICSIEEKFASMEESIQFLSNKYEEVLSQIQSFNKTLSATTKERNDMKAEINLAKAQINTLEKYLRKTNQELDDLGQYLRRDCIEVVGAKAKDSQECNKIVMAMAKEMGFTMQPNDISTSHPLPTPRDKDDKFIVKFTRRETKDKFYSNRQKIAGRKPSNLPSVKSVLKTDKKLYISESLTPLRRKLFGSVNDARKTLKWKYIWTNNGKIYLKENEDSYTTIINSFDDFNSFQDRHLKRR